MNFLKKNVKILSFIGIIFLGWMYLSPVSTFNSMVRNDENTKKTWGNVETAYQQRMDLLPNLLSVVKGYATHEKETLEGVIEARAKATSTKIDPSNMSKEQIQTFMDNQDGLSSALSKLMVVVERYPELKANEGFLNLQSQLEGMENRIRVERNNYNKSAETENKYIRTFPNNLMSNMFGFNLKDYFKSQEGADIAPKLEF